MRLIHTPIITHSCSKMWLWGVSESFPGRSGSPGATAVCVCESDLVLCHMELQACLEAELSLEGHETQREDRLRLVCSGASVFPLQTGSEGPFTAVEMAPASTHTYTHLPGMSVCVHHCHLLPASCAPSSLSCSPLHPSIHQRVQTQRADKGRSTLWSYITFIVGLHGGWDRGGSGRRGAVPNSFTSWLSARFLLVL